MNSLLKRLSGWHRLGIALTGLWLVAASTIYFSVVGSYANHLPDWVIAWNRALGFSESIKLFEIDCHRRSGPSYMEPITCGTPEFALFGFLVFLLLPVLIFWALGYVGAWVRQGFQERPD